MPMMVPSGLCTISSSTHFASVSATSTSEQSPSTPGREGTVFENSYTVTTATSLVFVIPDYYLPDNGGGVSVVITQVPEPRAGAWCLAAGGLLLAAWLRRRRAASV